MHYVHCRFCEAKFPGVPVFAAHAQVRDHLADRHPTEFTKMRTLEQTIRDEHSALVARYGYAVKPLRMNL